MWTFYQIIVDLIVNDKEVLDEFLSQASVPLVNFMQKNPD